jgi:hypothetical protein
MVEPHESSAGAGRPEAAAVDVDVLVVELAVLRPACAVRDLLGHRVVNEAQEQIGTLDDLMVEDDRVSFAVLSVGGFLGLGAHKVVVRFERLNFHDDEIILPGASREAVRRMTAYDAERVRSERAPRLGARSRHHDAGEIVETTAGEPISGTVEDITDGKR